MRNSPVSATEVTVAIPTYNRARLLEMTLKSVLSQDYPNFRVLVLDNASTDNTESVVASFNDSRITFCRSEVNEGFAANENRAIRLNRSPYLSVFFDDDIMLPGFLTKTVQFLDEHQTAGFVLVAARYIDENGALLHKADADLHALNLPTSVIPGQEYLRLSAGTRRGGCESTVLFRASAVGNAGFFDSPHCKHALELNLYFRLACFSDVGFVNEELAHIRLHSQQVSNLEWGGSRIGYLAEYIDAIAYLLKSERAEDRSFREWLSQRLMRLNARQSEVLISLAPNIYWTWTERLEMAIKELEATVPEGADFILLDEYQFGESANLRGRHRLFFLEKDGKSAGSPPDDTTATSELERMRSLGASYLVIAWPAFWWMDYYPAWFADVTKRFPCILNGSRLLVFDLQSLRD